MKHYLQTALLVIILVGPNAWAEKDYEHARELVKSGEILPLEQLLQQFINGESSQLRLLEAELKHKKGRLVYELELVDEQGVVRERLFDAKTGTALGEEKD